MKNREYIVSQLDIAIEALNNIKEAVTENEEKTTVTKKPYGDIPIGKTFEFKGKEYIVKNVGSYEMSLLLSQTITSICERCAFEGCGKCDQLFCCISFERHDNAGVYFIEKK